jgi:hypothetical protein
LIRQISTPKDTNALRYPASENSDLLLSRRFTGREHRVFLQWRLAEAMHLTL